MREELKKEDCLIAEHKSSKLIFVNKFKFTIWFTVFAGIVSWFNSLGLTYDDKNLTLYITSPPFWILENYSYILREQWGSNFFTFLRIITIIFWLFFGLFIDWCLRVSLLKKISSINPILILFPILFIGIPFLMSILGINAVVYVLIHELLHMPRMLF
ncbi:MAG: hypothetical protein P4L49_10800 [Desulfosporosinus sp.]|nr:hypothetical protein [Desulfosporosinus sp.]